jgi:hypothetical protein
VAYFLGDALAWRRGRTISALDRYRECGATVNGHVADVLPEALADWRYNRTAAMFA